TEIGLRTRRTNRSPPRLSLNLLHLSGPTTLPHQHRALFRRLRAIPALRRPAPTLTSLSRSTSSSPPEPDSDAGAESDGASDADGSDASDSADASDDGGDDDGSHCHDFGWWVL